MKLTALLMVFLSFFSSFVSGCSVIGQNDGYLEIEELFIEEISEEFPDRSVVVCDASDLDAETLEARGSTVIVERVIGFVDNEQTGDGVVINAADREYDYICYADCGQTIRKGTILVTYLVYEPDDDNVDTIIIREDFVICREFER